MPLPEKKPESNNKNDSNQKEFQKSKIKKLYNEEFSSETATKKLVQELSFSAN